MEKERPRPHTPIERGDDLLAEAEGLLEERRAHEPRCPYCHAGLPDGTLATACAGCNTLHHVGCFAEHRGCSIPGCGSSRARSQQVGAPPPQDFPRLQCSKCSQLMEPDALVARCACGRVLDTSCYELLGHCGAATCNRPVELIRHHEAVAQQRRTTGIIGSLAGAGFALTCAGALAAIVTNPPNDAVPAGAVMVLFFVLSLILTMSGVRSWIRSRAIAQLPSPGPRPPREPQTGKGDASPGAPKA